jgi:glycosyltransferase involved in cell wall biosynthesis
VASLSIIICCFNSSKRIETTLLSIEKLDVTHVDDFDVIIVDNASTDDTLKIILDFAKISYLPIRIFSETRAGKVNALRCGIEKSYSDYILICDDDVCLFEDYITTGVQIMSCNDRIGALGGIGFLRSNEYKLPDWFEQLQGAYALGSQNFIDEQDFIRCQSVWGAGMILRSDAVKKIFQMKDFEFLTGRVGLNVKMAGEDTELCILLRYLGYEIFASNNLRYFHDISRNRLNWAHAKSLFEGFARSQIYFDLYERVLIQRKFCKWHSVFIGYLKLLIRQWSILNLLKTIWIVEVENREGYINGLQYENWKFKIYEMLRIRKDFDLLMLRLSNVKNNAPIT